jgi:glycosyltransferase involved in cell wall biosynthesis
LRILYLINSLQVGGAEKSLLDILPRFRVVEPVMCHLFVGSTLKAAYQREGIRVISLGVPGRYSFRTAIKRVEQVVRSERPQLIHTTLFASNVVGRMVGRNLRVPVVSSLVSDSYGVARRQGLSMSGRLKLQVVQLVDAVTARWTTRFVAISETAKEAGCRTLGLSREKVFVIYRGRDPEVFRPPSEEQVVASRASLGFDHQTPIVLNVARLRKSKGQGDLIRAMPAVAAEHPQARLLVAGEGDYRAALEGLASQLDLEERVLLLGTRDDIPTLLHSADVVVFPSYYEGHGGALVEAMLAGRPIVASDIPVHRESITQGQSGLLVPLNRSQTLAENILWLLRNPAEAAQMGQRARKTAVERFDVRKIAVQHEDMYASVLREWQTPADQLAGLA